MPAPRRSIAALTIILIAAVLTVTASAAPILSENPSQYIDTGGQSIIGGTGSTSTTMGFTKITLDDIERARILNYIAFDVPGSYGGVHAEGSAGFTYSLPNGHTGEGVCYVDHSRNFLGEIIATRYTLFFYDWDIGALTGYQPVTINRTFATARVFTANTNFINEGDSFASLNAYDAGRRVPVAPYISTVSAGAYWQNIVTVESIYDGLDYRISLQRVFGGTTYSSTLTINGDIGTLHTSTDVMDISLIYPADSVTNISIENPVGGVYTYPIGSSGSPTNAVTVYVRNSQTGALLADAHIEIEDTTTDPWTEVVNQTLPSGQTTISLPKDPGIHLTQYRIGATVPGYQQVVPALFFRVVGPTNVVVEMEPVEGGPVNEDNAYLEFYVRDLNANGIPNANVQVDGKMRWTNAQGYTQIEVAKNASYPYSVSKSGYVTIEGTATVADGPRYVVNVVLGPGTVPTYTPGPGETPGETPGGPGATPTPDTRTNEEKGQAVIDMIADFAEPIALLAIVATVFGLMQMMMPRRR